MSMKMVCNRCNKVKEDGEHFNSIRYIYNDKPYNDSEYDLCPECAKLFRIFIDGGEVEEDRYKDSKPSAVVIHKLDNGHYAIEDIKDDEPEKKERVHHCGTCEWQYSPAMCPRATDIMHISCANKSVACEKWKAKETEPDTVFVTGESIDKEESKLCAENHTNAAGVTVPDSQPWGTPGVKRVDRVADAVSDNPDDPCPCYAKHCIHIATCCGCKEYDEWKERQK